MDAVCVLLFENKLRDCKEQQKQSRIRYPTKPLLGIKWPLKSKFYLGYIQNSYDEKSPVNLIGES